MSSQKNLSELQNLIQNTIQSQNSTVELAKVILEKPPLSIIERIKIYQDAYQIRLSESLRDDFTSVEEKIGAEEFDNLVQRFIRANPSTVQNLAEYSEKFPDFIKRNHPNAHDVATLDWLEILSTHAPATQAQLTLEEIQAGKIFKIQICPSTFVKEIMGTHLVVYRQDGEVKTIKLAYTLFVLLQFLKTERTVDEISDFAQKNNIEDGQMSSVIQQWIHHQIIYCKQIFAKELL